MKSLLTQQQQDFVKANYKTMAMKEMARQFNIPYSRVQDFMKDNNLYSSHPRATRQKSKQTAEGCFEWGMFKNDLMFSNY